MNNEKFLLNNKYLKQFDGPGSTSSMIQVRLNYNYKDSEGLECLGCQYLLSPDSPINIFKLYLLDSLDNVIFINIYDDYSQNDYDRIYKDVLCKSLNGLIDNYLSYNQKIELGLDKIDLFLNYIINDMLLEMKSIRGNKLPYRLSSFEVFYRNYKYDILKDKDLFFDLFKECLNKFFN